jgi:RNase P/RNase MRP subunit p29
MPVVLLAPFIWGNKKPVTRTYQEDGVTIVENRGPGLWGPDASDKIHFTETLSLGVEVGDENQMFWGIRGVVVDSTLNIYVLDVLSGGSEISECRLMKFDREGSFVWKVGRRGEGPGEFQWPHEITLTPSNQIAVLDGMGAHRVHFFDRDGSYSHTVRLQSRGPILTGFSVLPDGRSFACVPTTGQIGFDGVFYGEDGSYLENSSVEYRYGPAFSPGRTIMYGPGLTLLGDRVLMYPFDRYEVTEHALDGRVLRRICRDVGFRRTEVDPSSEPSPFRVHDRIGPCFRYRDEMLITRFHRAEREGSEERMGRAFLDFFDMRGRYLGSYEVELRRTLKTIDNEGGLYFVRSSPYPRISRCSIEFDFDVDAYLH